MGRKATILVLALMVFACLAWGADKSWTGVISDSNCGLKHSTPSDAAAACVATCVKGGAKYTFVTGGKLYQLDPQDKITPNLAGRMARITGTLEGETIHVTSAAAAPKKVKG